MTLKLQGNKLTAVMMLAALAATAFMGAGHVAAFGQSAQESKTTTITRTTTTTTTTTPESKVTTTGENAETSQVLSELLMFDNDVTRTSSATPLTNNSPIDSDAVTVAQTNVPDQTQLTPIAEDILIEMGIIDGYATGGPVG
jgi:paraquat-inducible protein B